MIETFSILTLTLARALGVYMIAASLGGLVAPRRWAAVLADYERSPGLVLLAAMFAFIVGLVLVSLHNLWTDPLAIVVSLIGWAALVEGIALLAVPGPFIRLGAALVRPGASRVFAIVTLVLGVLLLIAGLLGRATTGL